MDTLIHFGEAVKSLPDGKVGGYLVRFSASGDPDLAGDFFTKETDFGVDWDEDGGGVKSAVYYAHGLDKTLGKRRIAPTATLKMDDVGVWVETQLHKRDKYEEAIDEMARKGKLGWSSGTAPHLVEREAEGKAFKILSWPLGLDASLTPTPCEPRNAASVVPIKSLPTLLNPYPSDSPLAFPAPADGAEVLAADMSIAAVQRLQDRVWQVTYDLLRYQTNETRADRMEALTETAQQFATILPRVVQGILDGVAPESQKAAHAAFLIKTLFLDRNEGSSPLVGMTLAEQGEAALLAVDAWSERLRDANAQREAKDGRVISAANRAKIRAALDALTELYDATEPKPAPDVAQKALTSFLETQARIAALGL